MLSRRQQINFINANLRKILLTGKFPSISTLITNMKTYAKSRKNWSWGMPIFSAKSVVKDSIMNPADWNELQSSCVSDLNTLYDELYSLAKDALERLYFLQQKKAHIASKIKRINDSATALQLSQSTGGLTTFYDTFTTLDNVDSSTTADVDLGAGCVLLKRDPNVSIKWNADNAKIASENVYGGGYTSKPTQNFKVALSDYNEAFVCEIDPSAVYEVVVDFTGLVNDPANPKKDEVLANGLKIAPAIPAKMLIEWSEDGINYRRIANEYIDSEKFFSFETSPIQFVRLTVTGPKIGIKKLTLFQNGYVKAGTLLSKAYTITDNSQFATLFADTVLPEGTSIKFQVSTNPTSGWESIVSPSNTIVLNSTEKKVASFTGSGYTSIYEQDGRKFFLVPYAASGDVPIVNSTNLYIGVDQWKVEYFTKDWETLGEDRHVPTLEDWEMVYPQVFYTGDSTSASGIEAGKLVGTYTTGASSYTSIRCGVALPKGLNLKLTTYVYATSEKTLDAVIYGAQISSAVYLNGARIHHFRHGNERNLTSNGTKCTYNFKAGWNKLEVLLYKADTVQSEYLYIAPNFFSTNRKKDLGIISMVAEPRCSRVSQFDLLYNTPKYLETNFALSPDGAMINFNPNGGGRTDVNLTADIVNIDLVYNKTAAATKNTLYFKAVLERSSDTEISPQLLDYKLVIT